VERVSSSSPEIPHDFRRRFLRTSDHGRRLVEETGADVEELASLEYAKSGTGPGVKGRARGAVGPPGELREGAPSRVHLH